MPSEGLVKAISTAEVWAGKKGEMSKLNSPFRCFNSSPKVIRIAVMLSVRFPVSLRNVEGVLFESGGYVCHETVRCWASKFRLASVASLSAPWYNILSFPLAIRLHSV